MEEPRIDPPPVEDPVEERNTILIGVDSGRTIGVPTAWGFTDDILNTTFRHIEDAMVKSLRLHGRPTKDPVRGGLNLAEECGEVAEAALDATRPSGVTPELRLLAIRRMHSELADVAGYAFLLMISMGYVIEEEVRQWQSAHASPSS